MYFGLLELKKKKFIYILVAHIKITAAVDDVANFVVRMKMFSVGALNVFFVVRMHISANCKMVLFGQDVAEFF